MKIRSLLQALIAVFLLAGAAVAQEFPTKPVTLIVPTNPGSGPDLLARLLAQKLSERWGQAVAVINKPGAANVIGINEVAISAPDGYTMVVVPDAFSNTAALVKLPYDPLKDLTPVGQIAISGMVLVVHPSLPVKTVAEFVEYVKQNPGKINYGSAGNGSTHHMMMAVFAHGAGLNMVHVPYGGGPGKMQNDLLAGRLNAAFLAANAAKQFVTSDQLRALAVAGSNRMSYWPDVPSFAEAGFAAFDLQLWYGLLAQGGTPRPLVDKIYTDVAWVLGLPEIRSSFNKIGMEHAPMSSEAFTRFVHGEIARKKTLVKEAGIKAE
jgi:tripartite-type tricarboxylate transporter receptor subunit TctC